MKHVWIVWWTNCSEPLFCGVFTTKKLAQDHIKANRCDGGYWAIAKQPLDVEYECELEWKR